MMEDIRTSVDLTYVGELRESVFVSERHKDDAVVGKG